MYFVCHDSYITRQIKFTYLLNCEIVETKYVLKLIQIYHVKQDEELTNMQDTFITLDINIKW